MLMSSDAATASPNGVEQMQVEQFDRYDAPGNCRELLRRISQASNVSGRIPWKWDVIEFLEESQQVLRGLRQAHRSSKDGLWLEISEALNSEKTASTLPVGLRKQCEEHLNRREGWVVDFDSELRAIFTRGRELRERMLFEDVDRAGWFSTSGVSPLEVQRLLERHLDMHQRAARLTRQLKLLQRALQQQGAVSSRRRAFQAKTMGEKLQSSLVCLAAVAVAPVPGSSEMWLATTTMMWLDKDQAWQHVVYEHPRDADTETILSQFQCHSQKARQSVTDWLSMPPAARRGCVLIHNASVRRLVFKTHLVSCIDGTSDTGDSTVNWTSALENHPLGTVMKKALTLGAPDAEDEDPERIVIGAQRLAVVTLPKKPDMNWGWRGSFAYGDSKVGECRLREGGVFSFICVDCGLFVGDMESVEERVLEPAVNGTKVQHTTEMAAPAKLSTNPFSNSTNPFDEEAKDFVQSPEASAQKEHGPRTAVEVVNRTDDPVSVAIFAPKGGQNRFFRNALAKDILAPGVKQVFQLVGNTDVVETDFDVEIRIGSKKAKCEVVGGQVIFVDGLLVDG